MNAETMFKFCLAHHQEVVEAIEEKRMDPDMRKQGGNGSGHSRISDPTAMTAIRNASEIDSVVICYGTAVGGIRDSMTIHRPESWLRVVNYTKMAFAGKLQWDLVYQRYACDKEIAEIVENLHISTALYHTMLNNVLCFAKGVATGMKLVRFSVKK